MPLKIQHDEAPALNLTSMIDILFLLIIFFVLTFNMDVDKATVALPKSQLRLEVPKKAAIVSITENGQMRVSDGETASSVVTSPEDVLSFATGIVAIEPEKEFVLKADLVLLAMGFLGPDKALDLFCEQGADRGRTLRRENPGRAEDLGSQAEGDVLLSGHSGSTRI